MKMNNKGQPKDYSNKSSFWERTQHKIQSDFLCRPYVLDLIQDIKNKKIIDIGCGEGYVCRLLSKDGGKVTGVDNSEGLIEKAKQQEKRMPLNINYFVDSALELNKINSLFDIAVSVLVFGHFNSSELSIAVKKTFNVLKDKGYFILAVPHPFFYICRPKSGWVNFNYKKINYFEDQTAEITLFTKDKQGFDITAKIHTFQDYLNTLLGNGFIIEEVVEPKPTEKDLKTYPEMWGEEVSKPTYLIIKAKKLNSAIKHKLINPQSV